MHFMLSAPIFVMKLTEGKLAVFDRPRTEIAVRGANSYSSRDFRCP